MEVQRYIKKGPLYGEGVISNVMVTDIMRSNTIYILGLYSARSLVGKLMRRWLVFSRFVLSQGGGRYCTTTLDQMSEQ